jgi:lipoic acid synthetase
MGLREVVVTSVTRDDLDDGGASIWAETVRRVHAAVPGIRVEVLVPDFLGAPGDLDTVLAARPDVVGHNLETVPSRYPNVRPGADYARSLALLRRTHEAGFIAKTGLMVGLGETDAEVLDVLRDARAAGVDIVTIGQYLQPSKAHLPVERYVEPATFDAYRARGMAMGFGVVISAPLVRSSFHSDEQSAFVEARLQWASDVGALR